MPKDKTEEEEEVQHAKVEQQPAEFQPYIIIPLYRCNYPGGCHHQIAVTDERTKQLFAEHLRIEHGITMKE